MKDDPNHLFSKIGGRLLMNAKLVFTLVAMAALCTSAFSLESSGDWYSQAQTLYKNGSYQEAISAFDEGLKTDPQNASAWHHRGMALAGMGHGAEANQSIQKAMELIDQRLQENPEDQEALWLRAEEMDLFGKSEEALEAYGRVAELNSSHALEAWIRESDILAALGRYNQSVESFSRAMALVPANKSESQLGFQRRSENTFIFTKAWLIRGQIHRVSIGLYNISSKSFDEIEQINSDFVAALQLRGKAVDSSRHYGYIMSSLNCDIYSFNVPKMLPQAWPPCLTIAQINPTEDDFIEIANNLKEAVSLQNWSLDIQGSKVPLPEYSLLPGKAVRVHLGSGQENETDLFLDSNLELNDTTGSVSLRDGSGAKVASLDYWTKLDGSIAHQVTHYSGTAESDLEYPGTGDQGKMVQKAAGVGPFIAERTEIGPELAHSNDINGDGLQENTADDWYKKGTGLFENDSLEESVLAMERVIQLDPENSSAWLSIAITLGIMGNGSESSKAYEKALNLIDNDLKKNPQDARAWEAKSDALIGLGRQEESLDAIEKALEILNLSTERNPKDGEAWWSKANVLYGIGRSDEALQAYEKVIELNHTPRLADALLIKGYDFAIKGNYDEFKETFNQAIGLIPASDTAKLARTWNSAGFALAELGKEEEAFEAFEKYAQLSPGDRHSWRMKGDMASELGRYNVSIEAYDQALRIDPKWAEVWYKKGNALAKMDNHNDALKAFEKAVEISDEVIQKDAGNASGICIIKGYALIKLNRYDEAIEALDRALEIAPSSVPVFPAEAWNGKGDILLALGKNEDALEAYNKSIEFNPAFGRAWHGKGLAQSALGQFSEADLSFRVARKLGYQE
jgi:tetratricopeptide (TPR) repeat protein